MGAHSLLIVKGTDVDGSPPGAVWSRDDTFRSSGSTSPGSDQAEVGTKRDHADLKRCDLLRQESHRF